MSDVNKKLAQQLSELGRYEAMTHAHDRPVSITGVSFNDVVNDAVNHPTHYHPDTIEAIEAIEAWKLNFNLGNVVKYIARCEHKGNKEQDLKKALFYLTREIENLDSSNLS